MIYSLTVTNSIGESMTLELSNPWASGYAIKNIDGLGTPDMNVNTTPYGIGDGSVLGSIKAEYRIITIQLYPLAFPTVETARQKLYRFFQIKKEIVLTFNTENRLVTIEGYVQKIEPNIFENPESISIEVKCINPYFHKMMKDQTKFYGIEPMFEFVFSNEFEYLSMGGWVEGSFPSDSSNGDWSLSAQGKGLNVIFPKNSSVGPLFSNDGFKWTQAPYLGYNGWTSLVFLNDKFIVCNAAWMVGVSEDGDSWNVSKVPGPNNINEYILTQNVFLVVGNDICLRFGYGRIIGAGYTSFANYTRDGITWNPVVFPETYNECLFTAGVYAFGKIMLVSSTKQIVYTQNCIDWVSSPISLPVRLDKLWFLNGELFGFSYEDRYFYKSLDGFNWIKTDLHDESWNSTADIVYANGKYLAVLSDMELSIGGGGSSKPDIIFSAIYESMNGFNWSKVDFNRRYAWSTALVVNGKPILIPSYSSVFLYSTPTEIEYLDPIEFSQFTIDNRMTIEYEGEIDAGIRITIECQTPPGDIIIYNVDTLEYIQIFAERVEAASGAPLGPKDIIEISTESGDKYVRLLRNGIYYNILGAMNRGMTWFILKQGPNTFTYTTTDEHAAISMTFSYRDAYAAI